jgi:thiamine-phosphate pyrophosphorylase
MRGLYAIVDPERSGARGPIALADAILAGGCAALQLRAKHLADRELVTLGRALAERTRAAGARFVINDRPDLAVLCGADAVHLGQDDLSTADARTIVGSAIEIHRSTHDLAQARAAVAEGASAIGFGPVFATTSKDRPDPVVGVERLAEVVRAVAVPVIAIGGITLARAGAIRGAGAPLAAVISALATAEDVERGAAELHRALGGSAR